tara:strand:+ start:9807 stop:10055 length:249 start_codon:yes stop_codon:yes gene_type:complete
MKNKQHSLKGKANKYVKFSSLGIQMGLIIYAFTWGGMFLDEHYEMLTPWFTIVLSLSGVIGSLSLVIREVIKMNKEDDSQKV